MTTFTDRHRSDFNYLATNTPNGSFGDILWRDAAGDYVLWLMNTNSPGSVATLPHVTPDWHIKAAAEFDRPLIGPQSADILWQNDNGALALWQMNGTTVTAINALPNPGPTWHVVGDNDFTGDMSDDILFRNDNGSLVMWNMRGASPPTITEILTSTQNPGPTWHVVGTGDTDGDTRAGVLWQNDNGTLAIWENLIIPTTGAFTFQTVAALPAIGPSWHVKGMADLNGDGRADIAFQNDSGAVAVWEMGGAAGTTVTAMNLVSLVIDWGPTWHVVGLRDMNNDAHADMVLQNDDGAAAVWEDYTSFGGGVASFLPVAITPNPNPNGHVWDLL